MRNKQKIDSAAAHRYFSAECFNKTWSFIEMKKRTRVNNIEMIASAFASLWHWIQRTDCRKVNLSIAYWQISRVYSLVKDPANAVKYGKLSLESSRGKILNLFTWLMPMKLLPEQK